MRVLAPLAALAFGLVATALLLAFFYAPVAQCDAGCLTQKIFYFHVPSAYAMYIGVGACVVGAIGYLAQRTHGWDALAQAGAELAVLFGVIVLTTGPIWARKAWGHFWVWDPRLTTTLLATLIFVAYLVLRTGAGEAEKKFSAALAVMGSAIIPIIHYSVQLWRGQHPTVISRRGGGLEGHMATTLGVSFVAFTVLAAVFLLLRTRMAMVESRIEALRTEATSAGLTGEST
jgi:heme exporter protein C